MTRFPIALAAAALLCGTAASAQMKPAAKPTPAKTVAAKPAAAAAKPAPAMAAKPALAAKPAPRAKAAAAPAGRMVSAKLSNGKTVTYNCSLAGNKTKKACQ
ncbi:hypothetical protein AB5I39_01510 [Sphingomonas sp. MMS24-J45]|uniref:hypothetical protein n=1 Tax=Sphingomonas sp. MMS24-J45 TaxID=3238806 RepID=UPI003850C9AB